MQIGVFDSGFGGLTVLRALLERVPDAAYHYLGDSARLPYGSKSARTVAHYATSSAQHLVDEGADLIVIACNTATALALDEIKSAVQSQCGPGRAIPVIGVIEPGAQAAARASRSKRACVIATHATVSSHAYTMALAQHGVDAQEKACPLFVPLVEEGWVEHPVTEQVARIYLDEMFAQTRTAWPETERAENTPDVLVLGCTHYPLLKPLLSRMLPAGMQMIDSADAVAEQVQQHVDAMRESAATRKKPSKPLRFSATDSLEKFRQLGQHFLGQRIRDVELVALPE